MDINEKVKTELEERVKKIEDFIADRGLGSKQLQKARRAQRNVNLAVFVGSLVTIAGITVWALSSNSDED
jgi:ribosome-associated translation inhibitor RaiA